MTETAQEIVLDWQDDTIPLTADRARQYLDYAVEFDIPTDQLLQERYCQRILQKCLFDTKFFALVFMGESFDEAMTWQHDQIWRLLDDDTLPKTAVCMWRGGGKTTSMIAKIVKSICFRQEKFIMVVGKSFDYAARITENVKLELMANLRIRKIWGSVKQRSAAEIDQREYIEFSFSQKGWFACDPATGTPFCFILPKGCNQQVRGMNVRIAGRMQRPTLMFIDDLEDDEEVLNELIRIKTRRWVAGALLPCVPRKRPNPRTNRWAPKQGDGAWRPPWRIIYVDTLKHEDSQMAHILQSGQWRTKIFPQSELRRDTEGKLRFFSLVPELISHEQVRRDVSDAKAEGSMDEYCREYMCLPMDPVNAQWTRDIFKRYEERIERLNKRRDIHRFLIIDPARTSNSESCPTGMLAFGADMKHRKIWVRKEINARLSIKEIPDIALDLALEMNSRLIAVEVNGVDDWMRQAFFDAAAKRGMNVQFLFVNAPTNARGSYGPGEEGRKRRDAAGAARRYKDGHIYHEVSLKDGPLEMQQLSFPKPARWDSLDCLGHLDRVLQQLGLFFEPVIDSKAPKFEDEDDWGELTQQLRAANRRSFDPADFDPESLTNYGTARRIPTYC